MYRTSGAIVSRLFKPITPERFNIDRLNFTSQSQRLVNASATNQIKKVLNCCYHLNPERTVFCLAGGSERLQLPEKEGEGKWLQEAKEIL